MGSASFATSSRWQAQQQSDPPAGRVLLRRCRRRKIPSVVTSVVALEQTFAIRGPVCVALPYFRVEQTDREAQWSAASFDSVNGLPHKKIHL